VPPDDSRAVGDDEPTARDSGSGSVGNLELFFDLVFVYAMAQLTELVLADVSWRGFGHGVLGLMAVWWAWVCYAWLTNTFTATRVASRCLVIAAMAVMLLAASALPTAFSTGALVFGLALVVVRVIHLVMFFLAASHDDERLRTGLVRLTPSLLTGPVLIAVAAAFASPYRELLWVGAAVVDYGGPLVAGVAGFRVVPSYFVERHGNIIIIVLGEAIVGLGAGATAHLRQPAVLAAAVLGVLIAASLWWTYFGLSAGAEQRLQRTQGSERTRLARDAYSYLHLPLVGGVGFFAFGAGRALEAIAVPLPWLAAVALGGGVGLYYAADVAYRWRDHHQLVRDRLLASVASLLVIPLATTVPAWAALAVLTAVCALRLAWELVRRPRIGPVAAGNAQ
jgi:low temperature requirement protein LtrA